MEKLKQTEKPELVREATFEELNPDWSNIIAKQGGFDKVDVNKNYADKHNIQNYECCIVGEAHSNAS